MPDNTYTANLERLRLALAAHPRAALSDGATPLQHLPRLGDRLGIRLWTKRDDTFSLAFGGNKIRQLEYYLGQAVQADADCVLITGAVQSNFVRLTAAAARILSMQAIVQLEKRVDRDDDAYLSSGNVLLDRLFGAEIHHFDLGEDEQAADANLERLAQEQIDQGLNPYVIHLGIDHPPIGGLGYVQGALELAEQIHGEHLTPGHLVVASGSGLTHAGLLVGCCGVLPDVTVHGICVRRDVKQQHHRILQRSGEIEQLLKIDSLVTSADVHVDDSVLAPGYGQLNAETAEAIRLAAQDEALLLDPVYTGRSLAGLIHLIRSGRIARGDDVVFVHTGGSPGLFAYQSDVMLALESSQTLPNVIDRGLYRNNQG